jgi:hypothetical protein
MTPAQTKLKGSEAALIGFDIVKQIHGEAAAVRLPFIFLMALGYNSACNNLEQVAKDLARVPTYHNR